MQVVCNSTVDVRTIHVDATAVAVAVAVVM